MPRFSYIAKNKAGDVTRGSAEADDERALTGQLEAAGLWVTQVKKDRTLPKDIAQDSAAEVDDLLRHQAQTLLAKRWKIEPQADGSIRLIQTPGWRHESVGGGCMSTFAILWNIGMILAVAAHFGVLPVRMEGCLGAWGLLFLSPFILFGLFMLWGVLWMYFGYEEWRISLNRLEMRRRWQFLRHDKVECFTNSSLQVIQHKDEGVVSWDLLLSPSGSAGIFQKRLLFRASDLYSNLGAMHMLGTLISKHTGWSFTLPDNYWFSALNDSESHHF